MRQSLGMTVLIYCLALAALCVLFATTGKRRPPALTAGLVVLQLGVLGQALLDGMALIGGEHGPEVPTNLGYLLTSVIVLPVTASAVRLDPGRWGSAALAVGCLLLAVVSVRLEHTLVAGRA